MLKPLAVLLALSLPLAAQTSISVTNPTATPRPSEVLDLPLAEVSAHVHGTHFAAHRHNDKQPLLTQLYASTIDGPKDRLLLLIDLAPSETTTIDITATKTDKAQPSRVTARNVPERKDDFAWENDVVAFRTYGPALQATGEISSGIDIWSKRVPTFVTTSWYKRDEEAQRTHNPALSYHKDNGDGLDSYDVGPSRGCGGTAVFAEGKLIASKNFTASRILANGPIRTDFVLDYAPWQAAGATVTVTESKRITLDAGSRLNHMRSTFTLTGATDVTIAAGIAMHPGAVLHQLTPSIASVWDTPQFPYAGPIATALLANNAKFATLPIEGKAPGHALYLFNVHSGDTIDYFAGTAYSRAGVPTQADFDDYLTHAADRLQHPITIKWKH